MAQYYWTPDPADLGGPPSGWTNRFGSNVLTVKQDANNDYYLEISGTSDTLSVSTLDTISGVDVSNVGDCEVFGRYRAESLSTNRDFRQLVKFSGTSLSTSTGRAGGYIANLSNVYLNALHGEETAEANVAVAEFAEGTTIAQRLQTIGNDHKAKVWDDSLSEPPRWSAEVTSSLGVQPSGRIGQYRFFRVPIRIYAIGLGTNGDPAPTEPPATGDNLSANDISSLSSVSSPALTQTHSLSATDVQSSSEVTNPALAVQANTDNLTANDISSTSSVSAPALGQVHNLAANDATSNTETGTPTLQQTHALTSVDVSSLSTVSSPALTSVAGQDSLAANDVQATSTVSSTAIGQVHNLTANDLSSASETDSPNLGQVHTLTANDIASATQVSSPTLRDASQVLVTPIKNTKATVSQTTYKAAIIQPVYKAEAG